MQAQEIAAKVAALKGFKDDAERFAAGAAATKASINAKLMK
jgi:hypothetical protein